MGKTQGHKADNPAADFGAAPRARELTGRRENDVQRTGKGMAEACGLHAAGRAESGAVLCAGLLDPDAQRASLCEIAVSEHGAGAGADRRGGDLFQQCVHGRAAAGIFQGSEPDAVSDAADSGHVVAVSVCDSGGRFLFANRAVPDGRAVSGHLLSDAHRLEGADPEDSEKARPQRAAGGNDGGAGRGGGSPAAVRAAAELSHRRTGADGRRRRGAEAGVSGRAGGGDAAEYGFVCVPGMGG